MTRKYAKVHPDGIIICRHNIKEELAHLHIVLQHLHEYEFYIKLHRYKFLYEQVTFLGHIIDAHGIHIAREKVLVV